MGHPLGPQVCSAPPAGGAWGGLSGPCPSGLTASPPKPAATETFCETVQFYLRHLEDSVYPVMTEDQFAVKLFPLYRYFVTVWLRNQNPEVRSPFLGGGRGVPWSPQVTPVWLGGLRDPWARRHSWDAGETAA